jgi:hypothetical protein
MSEVETVLYFQGARDALQAFGVWKDGVQYVNTEMGRRVSDCLETIAKEIDLPQKSFDELR